MRRETIRGIFDEVLGIAADKGFPDAFIAGGAVRDMLHGQRIKDIDVFTFREIPEEFRMFADDDSSGSESDPSPTPRVRNVSTNIIIHRAFPVELIELTWPQHLGRGHREAAVKDFAIGLDQAWYSNGTLQHTTLFARDRRERTLTITRAESPWEAKRSITKIKRLWAREAYLNYRIVISRKYADQFFDDGWLATIGEQP